ncbi:MAG: 16S rRNA processing protein RimM [Myxococcales bacterium]|nr:16S rRNA processing protein RimM [Myxococcales bacterium]
MGASSPSGASGIDHRIAIGYVAGVHGVRGEILARTDDPSSDVLEHLETLFIGTRSFTVAQARPTPKGVLLRLEGVVTRNEAETLRSQPISAHRDDLIEDEDDVLLQDMIGCRVLASDGAAWGEVVGIEWGLQDRLIIEDDEFERQVPVVDELVVDVDLDARQITVACGDDWPKSPRRHA